MRVQVHVHNNWSIWKLLRGSSYLFLKQYAACTSDGTNQMGVQSSDWTVQYHKRAVNIIMRICMWVLLFLKQYTTCTSDGTNQMGVQSSDWTVQYYKHAVNIIMRICMWVLLFLKQYTTCTSDGTNQMGVQSSDWTVQYHKRAVNIIMRICMWVLHSVGISFIGHMTVSGHILCRKGINSKISLLCSGVPRNFFRGGFNKFSWGQRTERTGIWGQ